MNRIQGLEEYINGEKFRNALKIPMESNININMLAQGEYNINYYFFHPLSGEKLILRINTGSQMHLDNQIEYEYNALKALEISGQVPKVYYVDGSKSKIEYGLLVMEFLNGYPLDYKKDLHIAAKCLSYIHSTDIKYMDLISPSNPLKAMLIECKNMALTYLDSDFGEEKTKKQIQRLIDYAEKMIENEGDYSGRRCCINTELNSGNFLINKGEPSFIIDWEKPIIGEAAQDLAHFLAPTTTFWKTDIILSGKEVNEFLKAYKTFVGSKFDTDDLVYRFRKYMPLTCLRGITWCSMAFVEYENPNKVIQNEFTYNKIKEYLKPEFLDKIEKEYFFIGGFYGKGYF